MNLKEFDRRMKEWSEESIKQFKTIAKECEVPVVESPEMAPRLHEWTVDMYLPEELGFLV